MTKNKDIWGDHMQTFPDSTEKQDNCLEFHKGEGVGHNYDTCDRITIYEDTTMDMTGLPLVLSIKVEMVANGYVAYVDRADECGRTQRLVFNKQEDLVQEFSEQLQVLNKVWAEGKGRLVDGYE